MWVQRPIYGKKIYIYIYISKYISTYMTMQIHYVLVLDITQPPSPQSFPKSALLIWDICTNI